MTAKDKLTGGRTRNLSPPVIRKRRFIRSGQGRRRIISNTPVDTKVKVIFSAASHSTSPSGFNKRPSGGIIRVPPAQRVGQMSPTEASNETYASIEARSCAVMSKRRKQ